MSVENREKWKNYEQLLLRCDVVDQRYPLPGFVVWLPWGVKIKQRVVQLARSVFEKADYLEVQLPLLIPLSIYEIQPDHYAGLEKYTYFIDSQHDDEPAVIRTTSETPFTSMFRNWIVERGLPLRFFQHVSVYRHEKETKLISLIRSREIEPFVESYTALASDEETEVQIATEVDIYKSILRRMSIPFVVSRRPKYDTFPEAQYSVTFDTILPAGHVSQVASVHHLGQSFGTGFDVRVGTGFVYQTSTGISGRSIGCMLLLQASQSALVLPPSIAPYKVVLIGQNRSHERLKCLLEQTKQNYLEDMSIRKIENVEFSDWYKKGIPLFVQADEKDNVKIISRISTGISTLAIADFAQILPKLLEKIQVDLEKRVWHVFLDAIVDIVDIGDAKMFSKDGTGIARVFLCQKERCLSVLRQNVEPRAAILGRAEDEPERIGACIVCHNKEGNIFYIGIPS